MTSTSAGWESCATSARGIMATGPSATMPPMPTPCGSLHFRSRRSSGNPRLRVQLAACARRRRKAFCRSLAWSRSRERRGNFAISRSHCDGRCECSSIARGGPSSSRTATRARATPDTSTRSLVGRQRAAPDDRCTETPRAVACPPTPTDVTTRARSSGTAGRGFRGGSSGHARSAGRPPGSTRTAGDGYQYQERGGAAALRRTRTYNTNRTVFDGR